MTDIFISYQHEDKKYAHALAKMLASQGYDVWWDINLLPGQKFADEINSVIKNSKITIVLWTERSINSEWVKAETTLAMEKNTLIPIWLEKISLPAPYNTLHTLDLTSWNGDYNAPILDSLLTGIQNIFGEKKLHKEKLNKKEIERALEKPAFEVEFWTAVSSKAAQSASEYNAYLEKYGSNGSFSELAHIRIKELEKKQKNPKKVKTIISMGGILVGITVGLFQIASMLGWISPNKNSPNEKVISEPLATKKERKQETLPVQNKITHDYTKYIDNNDGTITDTENMLMWKKCPEGQSGLSCEQGNRIPFNWKLAMEYPTNHKFADFDNWRLPNIKELSTLFYTANGNKRPLVNQDLFPNTSPSNENRLHYYWSSSTSSNNPKRAQHFDFSGKGLSSYEKKGKLYVRLIRDINKD